MSEFYTNELENDERKMADLHGPPPSAAVTVTAAAPVRLTRANMKTRKLSISSATEGYD